MTHKPSTARPNIIFIVADDLGYADLGPLFQIGPWVFLFLVPAITMRSFSEEKRTGTLELLLTRPLTELQLVLAKYTACLVLVLLAHLEGAGHRLWTLEAISGHVRLLLVIPLLFLAESMFEPRVRDWTAMLLRYRSGETRLWAVVRDRRRDVP